MDSFVGHIGKLKFSLGSQTVHWPSACLMVFDGEPPLYDDDGFVCSPLCCGNSLHHVAPSVAHICGLFQRARPKLSFVHSFSDNGAPRKCLLCRIKKGLPLREARVQNQTNAMRRCMIMDKSHWPN